ncbi:MAG TPA: hypothetical protein VHR18_03290 [Solirubrobacterales bacterium]|jgi:hypothetical protein|nr:hypothetical protein [Solirubrobacterales bacterium]
MRDALKRIAGFRNPAASQDGAQKAAQLARETLDELGLFLEQNSEQRGRGIAD